MSDDDDNINSNKIYANRYQGWFYGGWYFLIDSVLHFENILAIILFALTWLSQDFNQIEISYPITAIVINISLMSFKNLSLEMR